MSDTAAVLVCSRVVDLPAPKPTSTTTFCSRCDYQVWIAPTGVELVRQQPLIRVVCFRCVPEVSAVDPIMQILAPPGAFPEAADPDVAAAVRFFEGMNDL